MAVRDIDIVIHSPALKHVSTAEHNPIECVRANVLGTESVIHAAVDAGVETVISLSTDKAASPLNLYGASKLAADLPHRIIGIRPDEKLHEMLIAEGDSRTAVVAHDSYVTQSSFGLAGRSAALSDAELTPEGFRYASDTAQMRRLIETA